MSEPVVVLIASYLEPEHVEEMRALGERVEVIYEPELLGRPTYRGDHSAPIERSPGEEARWREHLARAEVLFDFDRTHLHDLRELAPRLRWIQGTSAGIGQLVKRMGLTQSPVVLTSAVGLHATPLAEFALMAMLMFVKMAFHLAEEKAGRRWQRYSGPELRGQTLLIVGLGGVGSEVARLGRSFGMRVLGTKKTVEGTLPESVHADELFPATELQGRLALADFLVLSCPHTPETERLIGDREIAAMKPGSVLINLSRGAVVDEKALVLALRSGHLGGAALDVFEVEPLPPSSPLWEMPNVLICPHSASTVDEENARLTELFCDNLKRYLAGQPLRNLFDKTKLY